MKKYLLSTLADGICVVLLSVCPILCYASAFSVKLESSVLIMAYGGCIIFNCFQPAVSLCKKQFEIRFMYDSNRFCGIFGICLCK